MKGWVETPLQSGNLSQQHNISTGKYVGWTYQHIRKKKKKYVTRIILQILLEIHSYWKKKSFDITTNTIPYKNGIDWLKYECPSDIINFWCLLLKADLRIFYFKLETLLNKLVKLSSYFFFRKVILNKNAKCFIFIRKVNLFSNRPYTKFLSQNQLMPQNNLQLQIYFPINLM